MTLKFLASAVVLAMAAAGCQQIPSEMSVAQYCGDAKNANKDVCKVNVEIDGQKKALAQTNMTLSEARAVADDAMRRANAAQSTADAAQSTANQALQQAALNCETKTINRQKTGACSPGYKLLSCTQTRYTFNAGAPSILRKISDEGCTFNDKVLEMQVRCCAMGNVPTTTEASVATTEQPTAPTQPTPAS
jgi:hypothetical protein